MNETDIAINYQPSDKDADLIVEYINIIADRFINWAAVHVDQYPKFIADYMVENNLRYSDCYSVSIKEILNEQFNGNAADTVIVPAKEGGWGEIKKQTLDDYLNKIAEYAFDHIVNCGFINYWFEDLASFDKPGFARLMIKANIRLMKMLDVPFPTLRNGIIERIYYQLHDKIL